MDLQSVKHFEFSEGIVDALCKKTQNSDREFFRILVAQNLCTIASMMRCSVKMAGRGDIPVNMYSISLAPSGYSKGYSTNIVEEQLIGGFIDRFIEVTFNQVAEIKLAQTANIRARNKGTDPDEELEKVIAEFNGVGELLAHFSEATVPAVKQYRRKLQMANAGALNYVVDEIGANLLKAVDVLTAFLELYDVGKIKDKLIKNTADNVRGAALRAGTPANMCLFGTPTKLLDGGTTEKAFLSFLDMGYGRRCFYGMAELNPTKEERTAEELFKYVTSTDTDKDLETYYESLERLSDPLAFNMVLPMHENVSIEAIRYQQLCEFRASEMPDYNEINKAEMSHRYFKVNKLAAAYAFCTHSPYVELEHLHGAIALAEDSGSALERILNRDKDFVRLAKFIAADGRPLTAVEISDKLPCFNVAAGKRTEMMNHAIAWGYRNHTVIKKSFVDGIEMFCGESLMETDLDRLPLSHGVGVADGWASDLAPWDEMHVLLQQPAYNWCNHALLGSHRDDSQVVAGFSLIVLDVDGTADMELVQMLLRDYKYIIHTTKSHTEDSHHFRIVMPLNYTLRMGPEEYREFIQNIYSWLPFDVDTGTTDRCRKWATHAGTYEYHNGELLDAMMFIPKTNKNEQRIKESVQLANLSNVERWFVQNTGTGNRSNNLIRFALMLVDGGEDIVDIDEAVKELNAKIPDPLSEVEIKNTVMRTVANRIKKRE